MWRLLLLACVASGCSPLADEDSRGDGVNSRDCELDIVVSDGYVWKSASAGTQLGCAALGPPGTMLGVEAVGPGEGVSHEVFVMFGAPNTTRGPLQAGEVGTFDVVVNIQAHDPPREAQWQSAFDGCSFKVTKNESTPDEQFVDKYVIGGTITCADPLPSFNSVDTVDPITVNAFKFQTKQEYAP